MTTTDLRPQGANGLGSPAVAVPGTSTLTQLYLFQLGGRKSGGLLTLTNTGANALTGLQLTRAATPGGTHVPWIVGSAFGTTTNELTSVTSGINTLGSSAVGQVKLNFLEGTEEIGVWAEASTATTLQVDACFG